MGDFERYRVEAERVVKRLKKTELIGYIARREDADQKRIAQLEEHASALREELDARRLQVKGLEKIQDVVALVISSRTGTDPKSDRQMALLFAEVNCGTSYSEEKANTPTDVLGEILDNCEAIVEEVGGGRGAPSYDEVLGALDDALADREALLGRLGLTDAEWSAQGGACDADFNL